jgi:hypothetical protein
VPSFGSESETGIHSSDQIHFRTRSNLSLLVRDQPTMLLNSLHLIPLSPASDSREPLFDDREITREETAQVERMEAMQGALTDLIVDENRRDKSKKSIGSDSGGTSRSSPALAASVVNCHQIFPLRNTLVPQFSIHWSIVRTTTCMSSVTKTDSTSTSLLLRTCNSHDITRLGKKINKLQSREVLLEALTLKAERQNSQEICRSSSC